MPHRHLTLALFLSAFVYLPFAQTAKTAPATPEGYPEAETYFYREGKNAMRLHLVKPDGWQPSDKRSAFIHFFGGGWLRGSPDKSIAWAKSLAKQGMVGIAPDYRVKDRFDTTPFESVADARAALRWIQDHAEELGIDPRRIAVSGSSAGGHIATWTAICHSPFGSHADEAPHFPPAALILFSPVSNTSEDLGYAANRFGGHGLEVSPIHQLDPRMPPLLLFHGDADTVVPQAQSVALHAKYIQTGNECTFVSVPDGSHSFASDLPEWKAKSRAMMLTFLAEKSLLPAQ